MDMIAENIGLENSGDWNRLEEGNIINVGGDDLLQLYGGNIVDILLVAYPHTNFQLYWNRSVIFFNT
jgi:hypothetical protein